MQKRCKSFGQEMVAQIPILGPPFVKLVSRSSQGFKAADPKIGICATSVCYPTLAFREESFTISIEMRSPGILRRICWQAGSFRMSPAWAAAFLLWPAAPALAQRFEVTPLIGYRFGGAFDVKPDGQGSQGTATLHDSAAYGIAAGYRLDEESLVEFRWTRQRTEIQLDAPTATPLSLQQNATLDQFHGDFTHEYFIDDHPTVRPFIIGSVGASRLALPSANTTRFSFGLGAGVKLFPHPRFGLRIAAEWLPIWVSPEIRGFVCSGGCVVAIGGRLAHQGQVSIGPVFRF